MLPVNMFCLRLLCLLKGGSLGSSNDLLAGLVTGCDVAEVKLVV